MTTTTTHSDGMPVWIDTMVPTGEARERLMAFYSSIFGWTWDVGVAETGFYSIAQRDGSAVMGIGQMEGTEGRLSTYFSTSDIDAAVARAAALGATVFMPPMQVMDVGSMAMVLDPSGVTHGFWQANAFHGFGAMYELNTPGWFDHGSDEPVVASAYYQELLGHDLIQPEPEMRVLTAGDQWFASISHNMVPGRTAQWSPIFVVDALRRAHEDVRTAGGTVVLEEMPVPGSAISIFTEPVMNAMVTVMAAGEATE